MVVGTASGSVIEVSHILVTLFNRQHCDEKFHVIFLL